MSTSIGTQAEDTVANYLRKRGYKIIAHNWRNRWCEIDIVAAKRRRIHFVEVKYRRSDQAGSGLEYITPRKLQQLKKAALNWVAEHEWSGDYQIDAAAVDGTAETITLIENITQ